MHLLAPVAPWTEYLPNPCQLRIGIRCCNQFPHIQKHTLKAFWNHTHTAILRLLVQVLTALPAATDVKIMLIACTQDIMMVSRLFSFSCLNLNGRFRLQNHSPLLSQYLDVFILLPGFYPVHRFLVHHQNHEGKGSRHGKPSTSRN